MTGSRGWDKGKETTSQPSDTAGIGDVLIIKTKDIILV